MLLAVSENSSSMDSQDEQDFQIQEKILKHLVEPQKVGVNGSRVASDSDSPIKNLEEYSNV